MVKIIYMSWLATSLKMTSENMQTSDDIATITDLKTFLAKRAGPFNLFKEQDVVYCAINGQTADSSSHIKDGDEISFFSPIAGG